MKVVYIAGPFRSKTGSMFEVQQNVMVAMSFSLEVWRNNGVAICPHSNTMFFTGAAPDDTWLKGDIELLRRCDGVLMLPNWIESSGARAECEVAIDLGLPIFYFDSSEHFGPALYHYIGNERRRLIKWLSESEAGSGDTTPGDLTGTELG